VGAVPAAPVLPPPALAPAVVVAPAPAVPPSVSDGEEQATENRVRRSGKRTVFEAMAGMLSRAPLAAFGIAHSDARGFAGNSA
jgi:hypothetical protein